MMIQNMKREGNVESESFDSILPSVSNSRRSEERSWLEMRIKVTYVLSFVDILFAAELGNILVIEKCEGVLMTASHHQGYRFVLHYPNLELNLSEYYGY